MKIPGLYLVFFVAMVFLGPRINLFFCIKKMDWQKPAQKRIVSDLFF